jgi:hypothetical protein
MFAVPAYTPLAVPPQSWQRSRTPSGRGFNPEGFHDARRNARGSDGDRDSNDQTGTHQSQRACQHHCGYAGVRWRQAPCVRQSRGWAAQSITRGGTNVRAARLSRAFLDVLPLPGGWVWLHEEYHRAAVGRRGINSFNDVYKLQMFSNIAVSHVVDEDLVRLKREHPAELVRASAAGIEGQAQLVQALERNQAARHRLRDGERNLEARITVGALPCNRPDHRGCRVDEVIERFRGIGVASFKG